MLPASTGTALPCAGPPRAPRALPVHGKRDTAGRSEVAGVRRGMTIPTSPPRMNSIPPSASSASRHPRSCRSRSGTRSLACTLDSTIRPPDTAAGNIDPTDPDSRQRQDAARVVQDYYRHAATNEQQIVIAAEATIDSPDFGHLGPNTSRSWPRQGTASKSRHPAGRVESGDVNRCCRPTRQPAVRHLEAPLATAWDDMRGRSDHLERRPTAAPSRAHCGSEGSVVVSAMRAAQMHG
jgi:hypothetical protein